MNACEGNSGLHRSEFLCFLIFKWVFAKVLSVLDPEHTLDLSETDEVRQRFGQLTV